MRVPRRPFLGDLVTLEPVHPKPEDLERLAGRHRAEKRAVIGPHGGPSSEDDISLTDDRFDRHFEIGKGGAVHPDEFLVTIGAVESVPFEIRSVTNAIWCEDLIDGVQLPLTPHFDGVPLDRPGLLWCGPLLSGHRVCESV